MKLVSVQSRGDRLVTVEFLGYSWRKKNFVITKKYFYKSSFGGVVCRTNRTSCAYTERSALKAAEAWLKGEKR